MSASARKMVRSSTKYWMNGDYSHSRVRHIVYAPVRRSALTTLKNKQTIGPASADLLQALTSYDLRALTFGRSAFVPLEGINVHVARGGYTGEDGFEVCCPIQCLLGLVLFNSPPDAQLDLRSPCANGFPRVSAPPFARPTRRSWRTRFPATGGRNVSVWQRPGREHHAR